MSEPLIPKTQENSSRGRKILFGGLLLAALAGATAVYSVKGSGDAGTITTDATSYSILRVVSDEMDVKELVSMKPTWSHFNDVSLQMKTLTPYVMEGQLSQDSYETSFYVNYNSKTLQLSRKNLQTGQIEASLYSTKEKLNNAAIYQFTNSKETVTDGFDAFQAYSSSDLLTDTYLISLKLAQFGLTGKSAPVVKGFYSIAQTLAKHEAKSSGVKRYTQAMKDLVAEINSRILEENRKPVKAQSSTLDAKLIAGPCDRYSGCTCELNNTCGNQCFGLCGPDCFCWAFVCGDCNCHCFCLHHDYYCSCQGMTNDNCWSIWEWFDACC